MDTLKEAYDQAIAEAKIQVLERKLAEVYAENAALKAELTAAVASQKEEQAVEETTPVKEAEQVKGDMNWYEIDTTLNKMVDGAVKKAVADMAATRVDFGTANQLHRVFSKNYPFMSAEIRGQVEPLSWSNFDLLAELWRVSNGSTGCLYRNREKSIVVGMEIQADEHITYSLRNCFVGEECLIHIRWTDALGSLKSRHVTVANFSLEKFTKFHKVMVTHKQHLATFAYSDVPIFPELRKLCVID